MAKYRKKPIVFYAKQWFSPGDVDCVLPVIHSPERICENCGVKIGLHGWISSLEGDHVVCPGDWVITGVKGESYPVKNEIFLEIYEPIDDYEF